MTPPRVPDATIDEILECREMTLEFRVVMDVRAIGGKELTAATTQEPSSNKRFARYYRNQVAAGTRREVR